MIRRFTNRIPWLHLCRSLGCRPKKQKGVALLFAMVSMGFLIGIANELSYSVTVEYVINSQAVHRVKAYYAAKAGVELSLLRIKMYQKAHQSFGKTPFANSLNLIWSFPWIWPIQAPQEMNAVDKELIQALNKDSLMEAQYQVVISEEGSKIDINDLGSPYKVLREQCWKRIRGLIDAKIKSDEDWAREHRDFDFDQVLKNIADWVDGDTTRNNTTGEIGGSNDETTLYSSSELPPNRAFRSVAELRMLPDMPDFLYELLAPQLSVYGSKSVNPNTANSDVLRGLDPQMTDATVEKILERRTLNPFQDANDFWSFVRSSDSNTATISDSGIPLSFESVSSFRIRSRGIIDNKISHQIETVVFDPKSIAKTLVEADKKQNPPANNPPGGTPNPSTPAADSGNPSNSNPTPIPRGRPVLVEWNESL